ncbi:MAG TPA: DUF4296 domain-containing protein [Bacteroidia bacterium]|nr:DUF4296 domain-containing protein [Bacteroidia bacterium]
MICLFFIFLLFSCGKKKADVSYDKPKHLLSKAQMIATLAEMHLLEAAINLQNSQNMTQHKHDTLAYTDIFKHYGTNYADFQENFRYYSSNPDQLSLIYDGVITYLTRRQAEEDLKK